MKVFNRLALLTLAMLLPALLMPTAAAGKGGGKHEVRRAIEASPTGLVEIEVFDGRVEVAGWDKPEVEVRAFLDRAADEIALERTGSNLTVEVESRHPGLSRANMTVRVPRGSSVRIEVMSAGVEVRDVEGSIDVEAVNGNIRISGRPAKVRANTVTGGLVVQTGSSERLELETVSGSLEAEGEARYVDASTVAGGLRLRLRGIARGQFESMSGGITAEIQPARGGRFDFESFSGNVLVMVPVDVSGRFELESYSGRAKSVLAKGGGRRDDAELEFQLGGGDAYFHLETHSGGIEVRPLENKP